MTEANKDVQGAIENNEQEMIDEGAPVQPSTDPALNGGDDDPAGTEGGDSSDEESDSSGEGAAGADAEAEAGAAAGEAVEEPVQETDLNTIEAAEGDTGAEADADSDSEYKRRLREYTRELKKQPGDWYIIQSYSGYENKVKTNLDMRAQTLEVEDSIFEVVVPIEQVLETKDGKKKIVKRKLLPGYVLVRAELNDAAWSVIRETPGVTSFVGNEGNATPVKTRDVAKFLMPNEAPSTKGDAAPNEAEGEQVVAMPEKEEAKKYAHDFEVGEAVTILSGPLAAVSATISEIDPETGKMQGLVSIFGRETPVELSPTEIERIS